MKALRLLLTLALMWSMIFPLCAQEPVVVVVNKQAPVDSLTRSEVIDMFMGKFVAFPNGDKAQPVEVEKDTETKAYFYQQLVGMSMPRINAYWARLKFTGKSKVSLGRESESAIIEYLENTNDAIGYIPKNKVTEQLKIVYELNE